MATTKQMIYQKQKYQTRVNYRFPLQFLLDKCICEDIDTQTQVNSNISSISGYKAKYQEKRNLLQLQKNKGLNISKGKSEIDIENDKGTNKEITTIDAIKSQIENQINEFKIRKRILEERQKKLNRDKGIIRKDPVFIQTKFFKSEILQKFINQGKDLINEYMGKKLVLQEKLQDLDNKLELRSEEHNSILQKQSKQKLQLIEELQQLEENIKNANYKKKKEKLIQKVKNELKKDMNPLNNLLEDSLKQQELMKKETNHIQFQIENLKNIIREKNNRVTQLERYLQQDVFLVFHLMLISQNQKISKIKYNLQRNYNIQPANFVMLTHQDFRQLQSNVIILLRNDLQFLFELDGQKNLGLKQQLANLRNYIRHREDNKTDYQKQNLKEAQSKWSSLKAENKQLAQEVDLTAKTYSDSISKNKAQYDEIKHQNRNNSNLLKENETKKLIQEEQLANYSQLIESNKKIENSQLEVKKERERTLAMTQNIGRSLSDTLRLQNSYIQNLQMGRESLKKAIQQNQEEGKQSDKKNYINLKTLQSIEGLRAELKFKDIFIQNQFKNYQVPSKAFENMDIKDIGLMQQNLEKYKKMLTCSVCSTRQKKVILQGCCHTFCKQCIQERIDARLRRCPICRNRFGQEDIKNIWWQ